MSFPRSASLSLWLNACLDGAVGVDDFAVAVRDEDPQHLVVGWPGTDQPASLEQLPSLVAKLGGTGARLALPTPGDPLGLGGPPQFNADAVEAGEAVVLTGTAQSLGLIPVLDARTILWTTTPATAAPILDPAEEGRQLRQTLLHATNELVRLDVASWSPEVPDLLMNLQHRAAIPVPTGAAPQAIETLERATLCLEIVDLARADDGGAISAQEAGARARCLTDLDVAARRAIVAVCSASLLAS